jgi:tRNA threonylcarbamoyl adenosine modification protein YeaZ
MILLAIDCSSPRRSVAVARDERVLAEAGESAGRSTALVALIEEVLAGAGLPREGMETLAIGLGPGSYTGIRAAIALAQGWQLALGTRILGIRSMWACAHRCQQSGMRGRIAIVVDAQRDEFYMEEFELSGASLEPCSVLRLVSREEARRIGEHGVQLAGPEISALGFPGRNVLPDAAAVAELAVAGAGIAAGDGLQPIYLRPTSFVKAPSVPTVSTSLRNTESK